MGKIFLLVTLILFFNFPAFSHNEEKMFLPLEECNLVNQWFKPEEDYSKRLENLRNAINEDTFTLMELHELEEENRQILDALLIEENPEKINQLLFRHMEIEKTAAIYTRTKISQLVLIISMILGIFIVTTIWFAFVSNSSKHKAKKEKEINDQILTAQEKERQRIAHDLHDTITQDIRTALLYVRELKEKSGSIKLIDKIENLETQNLKNIRDIIQNLTTNDIKAEDFGNLISQHCAYITENRKIPCSFFAHPETDFSCLSTIQKLHIFRIIQEAVNNAIKHANASSINIIARQENHPRKMIFFISDDGQGIEASKKAQMTDNSRNEMSSHFGLQGMKYRASSLNAELELSSSDEMGTEIKLVIPLHSLTSQK